MVLALALCVILLFTMGLSFWPFLRRLNKVDLVFSFLSFSIGKCQLGVGGDGGALPSPASFPWGLFLAFGRCISEFVLPSGGSVPESLSGISALLCASLVLFLSFPVGLSSRCVCVHPSACVCILVMDGERGCPVSLLFLGVLGSLFSLVSFSGLTRVQGS